ncbi:helix-turn-helix transcriptional regulator [Nonomuraea mesophila]
MFPCYTDDARIGATRCVHVCERAGGRMPNPKKLDPDASPEARFGYELRKVRMEAGLTLQQVADKTRYAASTVSAFERAERSPTELIARRVEDELGLPPGRLVNLLPATRRDPIFRTLGPWLQVEKTAGELCTWEPLIVAGLLQTEAYARAILSGKPGSKESDTEASVKARMARQAIFERNAPPSLLAILDESILYRPIGSESITRDQLAHLITSSRHGSITIQILPFSAMSTPGLLGGFVIAHSAGLPDAAFVDSPVTGKVWDGPEDVETLRRRFRAIQSEALPQSLSIRRIEERLEEKWTWK